jgi:hypothetical protein
VSLHLCAFALVRLRFPSSPLPQARPLGNGL